MTAYSDTHNWIEADKDEAKVLTAGMASFEITGISKAASAVVTAANDLSAGDRVYFLGVEGMTEINNLMGVVTGSPSSSSFTVNINSAGFTVYSGGGTAYLIHSGGLELSKAVRVIYDTSLPEGDVIDALQRLKECLTEVLSAS